MKLNFKACDVQSPLKDTSKNDVEDYVSNLDNSESYLEKGALVLELPPAAALPTLVQKMRLKAEVFANLHNHKALPHNAPQAHGYNISRLHV